MYNLGIYLRSILFQRNLTGFFVFNCENLTTKFSLSLSPRHALLSFYHTIHTYIFFWCFGVVVVFHTDHTYIYVQYARTFVFVSQNAESNNNNNVVSFVKLFTWLRFQLLFMLLLYCGCYQFYMQFYNFVCKFSCFWFVYSIVLLLVLLILFCFFFLFTLTMALSCKRVA